MGPTVDFSGVLKFGNCQAYMQGSPGEARGHPPGIPGGEAHIVGTRFWLGGFAVLGSVLRLQIDLQDHLIQKGSKIK